MHRYRSQVKNLVECQSMDSEMMVCETPADKINNKVNNNNNKDGIIS